MNLEENELPFVDAVIHCWGIDFVMNLWEDIMEQNRKQPTKEEVREWLRDLVESRKTPNFNEIKTKLWPIADGRERKSVLS